MAPSATQTHTISPPSQLHTRRAAQSSQSLSSPGYHCTGSSPRPGPSLKAGPQCAKRPTPAIGSSFLGRALSTASGTPAACLAYTRSSRRRGHVETRSLWLDNRASVVVDVPVEEAFKMWEDREKIPQWMPWIHSVKVQKDRPELSKWTLRWEAFGQNIELNWMAKNLQPLANQKIHWRSEDGLPNRGAVRFFKKGPAKCGVEMTISYEVPTFLLPFAAVSDNLREAGPLMDLCRALFHVTAAACILYCKAGNDSSS